MSYLIPLMTTAEANGDTKYFLVKETGDIVSKEYLEKLFVLAQNNMKKLSDFTELTSYFFKEKIEYDPELLVWKKSTMKETEKNLELLENFTAGIDRKEWNKKGLENNIINWLKENDYGTGDFLWPMRVALSGRKDSFGPFDIAYLLGKDKTMIRIIDARGYLYFLNRNIEL